MYPVLFRIGSFPVNAYGLLFVVGFFGGFFLIRREFRVRGLPHDFASTVLIIGMISAIVGSRLFHVFENLSDYSGGNLINIFKGAGFSWYGGLLLSIATTIYAAHRENIHWSHVLDGCSPAVTIGYAFGRLGCFLSGDGCYGQPCSTIGVNWPSPFCMAFPNGATPTVNVVINTPIFEIAGAIALFVYLELMQRRLKTPTTLFAHMIITHAVMRFFVEFIRINPKLALGLSQAQWLSIAGVGVGIWFIKMGPKIEVPVPKPPRKKFSKKR
ncbi:MAG: prolipoprotein diacylglyceryl transferase [Deltaproteobacteria bacterium]|nr:prolipoprotein diacylglyceryl transferase [Deltaproteobacteria bacterium]